MKILVLVANARNRVSRVMLAFNSHDLAQQYVDALQRLQAARPRGNWPTASYTQEQWQHVWNMQYPHMESEASYMLHEIELVGA